MLKIIFFSLFMIPLIFLKNNFWMVQNMFFLLFFFIVLFLNYSVIFVEFSYFFSLDLMSYGLVVLSVWICSLMIMASEGVYKSNNFVNYFLFLIFFLLLMLVLSFCSVNLFMFYLFFESSLIPTLFLILGWGYQPERLQAGLYLLFYTLLASLPLLVAIFFMNDNGVSINFYLLSENNFFYFLFYFSMIFAFLVKMPMFFVHLWLPKAHVEAPVAGSMILAGVLLKLGGYGLLRVFEVLMNLGIKMNFMWVAISLLGGCLISLICLRQMDMKSLIAYSSVAHMGIVLSGLMTCFSWGLNSSYTLMIAHGLCSSGLFCLANISYERLGSRSLMINKGMINFLPSLSLWWFLLCSGNMAAPPSLNLLGEISLFNSIVSWSLTTIFFLSILSFFSAAYSLYLFSFSQQGKIYSAIYSFSSCNIREFLVLSLHWLPLNLLILKSDMIFLWI